MKKKIYFVCILFLLSVGTSIALPFEPNCSYEQTPSFGSWLESFDSSNAQDYCLYDPTTFFIRQDVFFNRLGEPFTISNPDMWTETSYSQQTGNIREVLIEFNYFAPSMNGTCVHQSINGVTGFYNSPQYILVTNANSNLSMEGTFDDAFYQFNNEIICDQNMTFSQPIKEFTNDFGSSFSGQSKNIGSLGFESKNIYIWNVRIVGQTTEVIW